MKKLIITGVAVSVAILYSCSSPTQKIEKAKDKVESAQADLDQARMDSVSDAQFNQESADMMANFDRELSEAKVNMEHSKKKITAEDKKMLADLEQRNKSMKQKLAEYKKSGKEEWSQFKTEFKHDMNELGVAIKDIGIKNTNTHTK